MKMLGVRVWAAQCVVAPVHTNAYTHMCPARAHDIMLGRPFATAHSFQMLIRVPPRIGRCVGVCQPCSGCMSRLAQPSRAALDSRISALKRAGGDLKRVLGEALGRDKALELLLDERLALRVVAAEGREHGGHARGKLRVEGVDLDNPVAQPPAVREEPARSVFLPAWNGKNGTFACDGREGGAPVARSILGVEVSHVPRKRADERPALVRVLEREVGVLEEPIYLLERVVRVGNGLHREELAEDKIVALGMVLVEVAEGLVASRSVVRRGELRGRCDAVSHSASIHGLVESHLGDLGVFERRQVVEARVLDATLPCENGIARAEGQPGCGMATREGSE